MKTKSTETLKRGGRAQPLGVEGCEAQCAIGTQRADTARRWRRLATFTIRRDQRWPASYVGKIVNYRFRWKYKDGTYGPWSKPVSAKVLP
ncbi:MAG TPA: hypothetical protein VGM51_15510 [Armatimonadota bacterium]